MPAKRLYVFFCGYSVTDKGGVLTYRVDVGKRIEVPFLTYLIQTDNGNILFDSGIDHEDLPYMKSTGRQWQVKEEDHLFTQLKKVGVSPEAIDLVVQSHLHADHSGLMRQFPKAQVVVQREEYNFAMNGPYFVESYYRRPYYDVPNIKWRILDGDEELVPGVIALSTPGHTPGHQSLMVDLPESGTILLTGDCAYLTENIERGIIPAIFYNPVQALHSLKRMKTFARITKGQLFFTHSMQQYETLKKPPEFYK